MVIQAPRPAAGDRSDPIGPGPRSSAGRAPVRPVAAGPAARPADRVAPGRSLVVLIGGHAEQGDDGAPLAAAATLLPTLPTTIGARLEIRRRPLLDVEDLAAVLPGERCLLIDAASGPPPGMILTGDLADLRGCLEGELGFLLRSARHDTLARLIDAASELRGDPIEGRFVAISGHRWGFGTGISPTVRDALPAFRDAIDRAIRRLAADRPTA